MRKIKFVDKRPLRFPKLTYYPNGCVPKVGDILTVTDNEAKKLLAKKNGTVPMFEEVKASRIRKEDPVQEVDNG